jgi:uncharacterized membrane protein YdjX (TVP38/TMEM64 family)
MKSFYDNGLYLCYYLAIKSIKNMRKVKQFIYKNIKSIMISVLVIGLFILASWISHIYVDELSKSTLSGVYGKLGYVILSIFGALLAGISSTPLIPLALAIWGVGSTIFLTAIGWTIGSLGAFLLARRFGKKLVCRLVNVCDLEDYKSRIKTKGLFFKLLIARIFLPVDILSYAIGLFTKMSWISFTISTFIGSALFAVLAVYASELSVISQILIGALVIIVFFVWAQKIIKTVFNK